MKLASRTLIAAVLAGAVMALAGFAFGSSRTASSPFERVVISLISGVLYAAVLTPLAMRLPPSRFARPAALFLTLYVTGTLTDLIEASFFTALLTPVTMVAALIIQIIPAAAIAVIVAVLVPSRVVASPVRWQTRPIPSWFWRLVVAGLLYVPAYYAFSAMVAPIEHPFYSDPTFVAQLQTRTPPDTTIIPLETLRGALFALALVPALTVLSPRRWSSLVYLALIGVVVEGIVPLLGLTTWPLAMRLGNFGELTGDALERAAVALALLAFPPLLDRLRREPSTLGGLNQSSTTP